MALILVLFAVVLASSLVATLRSRAEATRLRVLTHALEARVAERTRHLRQALDAAESQGRTLARLDSSREDVLVALEHQLRTPLGVVLGFADLMARRSREEPLTRRQAQSVAAITEASAQLLAVIERMMGVQPAAPWSLKTDDHTDIDAAMQGRTVLYIEDHKANLALMRHVMAALGPTLHTAETGQAGLALARDLAPDIILLDILLPDMDGFAVKARLDSDPLTQGIPVVALTAGVGPAGPRRAMAAGFVGWLGKPLDVQRLSEVMASALADADRARPSAVAA